jgi:thiamine biosynthesis lipoprotein
LRSSLNFDPALRFLVLALVLLATRPVIARAETGVTGAESVRARWLMGTVLQVRLPSDSPDREALFQAAFRAVAEVEEAASLWKAGTELQRVHARAADGATTVVSATFGTLVAEALRISELTGGAFSPGVGALVAAWDLRGSGRWPSLEERRNAVARCRAGGVRYDPSTRELGLDPGVTLDLDGIAKGFALDRAAEALRARGVDDALLNFGGQILVIGPPAGRPPREALVVSPFDGSAPVLSVSLRDGSLSTSSSAERARIVDGREAGHLVDPRTGELVFATGSVTVLASSGALADALSTAWAVEGPAGFRRAEPGGPFRRSGAVAFVLPAAEGELETLADAPFVRLRPQHRGLEVTATRP